MLAPLTVDLRAVRVLVAPDIKIVPGRAVTARVVAQQPGRRGSLSIAGYLLDAELPGDVRAGDDPRLVVRDVTAERVLVTITDPHDADPGRPAQQAQASRCTSRPRPVDGHAAGRGAARGGSVQVTERDAGGARGRGSEAWTCSRSSPIS